MDLGVMLDVNPLEKWSGDGALWVGRVNDVVQHGDLTGDGSDHGWNGGQPSVVVVIDAGLEDKFSGDEAFEVSDSSSDGINDWWKDGQPSVVVVMDVDSDPEDWNVIVLSADEPTDVWSSDDVPEVSEQSGDESDDGDD